MRLLTAILNSWLRPLIYVYGWTVGEYFVRKCSSKFIKLIHNHFCGVFFIFDVHFSNKDLPAQDRSKNKEKTERKERKNKKRKKCTYFHITGVQLYRKLIPGAFLKSKLCRQILFRRSKLHVTKKVWFQSKIPVVFNQDYWIIIILTTFHHFHYVNYNVTKSQSMHINFLFVHFSILIKFFLNVLNLSSYVSLMFCCSIFSLLSFLNVKLVKFLCSFLGTSRLLKLKT